jgi:hypothetical protein
MAGGGFVLRDDTATAVLGFQRNKAMGAFAPEELQKMALLGTHLQRASCCPGISASCDSRHRLSSNSWSNALA